MKRAIPSFTAEELTNLAREKGDNPEMIQDDITKVTMLDYSDLI